MHSERPAAEWLEKEPTAGLLVYLTASKDI